MDQKALRYEDFTVGELVEAKIDAVQTTGVSVRLGTNLSGFIPKHHWADDPRLKKPELRFRPGESITCRVLKVLPERKAVHLTCKKSLVENDGPAYSDASQLNTGQTLKGTIAMIGKGGVLVSFYGDLTGWIPEKWLLKNGIADMMRYFYVGQLIECTVIQLHETGKVTLALGKTTDVEPVSSTKPVQSLGVVVQCRVEKVFAGEEESSRGLEVAPV